MWFYTAMASSLKCKGLRGVLRVSSVRYSQAVYCLSPFGIVSWLLKRHILYHLGIKLHAKTSSHSINAKFTYCIGSSLSSSLSLITLRPRFCCVN